MTTQGTVMNDRRKHTRYSITIPVKVRVKETGHEFTAETKDISQGGARVRGLGPVFEGIEIEVTLDLTSISLPEELSLDRFKKPLKSVVKWARGSIASFGLEFDSNA